MKNLRLILSLILVLFIAVPAAYPCSTIAFFKSGAPLIAKNYDWEQSQGRIYVNKSGMRKSSAAFTAADGSLQWTSRYGSVTFNQFGREFPNGGMNEAGLTVEIMWLATTQYPDADERPALNELQWIQYALDNYGSVENLAANADKIRVKGLAAPVHYMACDAGNRCGTFEYIDGRLVIHVGGRQPYQTLTNSTYAESFDHARKHRGLGGTLPIPTDSSSLSRFVRGTSLARAFDNTKPIVPQAFAVLDDVAQTDTVWQIVYNTRSKTIRFRTSAHRAEKEIRLRAFQFSCKLPMKMADIQTATAGRLNFQDYDKATNDALVRESITALPVNLPPEVRERMIVAVSAYPSTIVCTE